MSEYHTLISALERLNAAATRVESAIAKTRTSNPAPSQEALRAAQAEIERLSARTQTLEQVNKDIEQRLNTAISKVQTVLSHQGAQNAAN